MFNKKFESRLAVWHNFRLTLETSPSPLEDVCAFYKAAPLAAVQMDPYDPNTWLDPWELLKENQYCEFSKILAICYTLQLTERFMRQKFEIHIYTNNEESSTHFLLFIQDKVIGYDWTKVLHAEDLPQKLQSQQHYSMPLLQ